MSLAKDILGRMRRCGGAALTGLMALLFASTLFGCDGSGPLPEETADLVVKKFYDHISEARLRGGTLLIREAYKLVDAEHSRISEVKFVQIVQKYPTGLVVEIVKTEVVERHAEVTIRYRVASSFGQGFTVRNVVGLNIDEATNTWRIDFTGENDSQDPAAIKAAAK